MPRTTDCSPTSWKREKIFGKTEENAGRREQIEFVSANPTGPLNVVSARAAAVGDSLARLLEATGVSVDREFYVNDHGSQVDHLEKSVAWYVDGEEGEFPEEGYRGDYVKELAERAGDVPEEERRAWILAEMIASQESDLRDFGVEFQNWFRESTLHGEEVGETLEELRKSGHTYEKEGATWFRSTDYGDDDDRVIVRSDGRPTYLLPDIAYHRNKASRGYGHVIDILGPDHHGHVQRMLAAMQALGRERDWLEIMIVQQVNLLRDGAPVKMSKRAGEFVTLHELVDEVGRDAARFFFVALRCSSHLNFDLELAKKKSLDNPVYYVQYAHARVASIFRHAEAAGIDPAGARGADFALLDEADDIEILKLLDQFPDAVSGAARLREPHRIPTYLKELAAGFHGYYHKIKIVTEDEQRTLARLALVSAVRTVLKNGLDLIAVSAPDAM